MVPLLFRPDLQRRLSTLERAADPTVGAEAASSGVAPEDLSLLAAALREFAPPREGLPDVADTARRMRAVVQRSAFCTADGEACERAVDPSCAATSVGGFRCPVECTQTDPACTAARVRRECSTEFDFRASSCAELRRRAAEWDGCSRSVKQAVQRTAAACYDDEPRAAALFVCPRDGQILGPHGCCPKDPPPGGWAACRTSFADQVWCAPKGAQGPSHCSAPQTNTPKPTTE